MASDEHHASAAQDSCSATGKKKKRVEILCMTQEPSGGVRQSSLMQPPGGLTTGPL